MSEQIQTADRNQCSSQPVGIDYHWRDEPDGQHCQREQGEGNSERVSQEHGSHLPLKQAAR